MEQTSLFVQLPGLRMHALAEGPEDGPLVLLLHGFPELSESWREVMPLLAAEGFRAVAPDLRGYGATDKPKDGYDIDTLAGDIAAMIRELSKSGRAHLVGHDWGGAIAYHVAAMHPDVVEKLAVVNCPHPSVMAKRIWSPRQLQRSWYMFLFQLPLLPEFALSRDGGELVPRMMASAMIDRAHFPRERGQKYAENFAQPGVARCALAYYRQMFRGFLSPKKRRALLDAYPRIKAPFRLIWGEEDVALRKELSVGYEPFFELPVHTDYLPGVGHFSNLEAPEKVAKHVLQHLRN